MLWLLNFLGENACLQKRVGGAASFEGRRKVNISRDNSSIKKREHAVLDVVLSDGRWVCKRVVTELFGQDPFCFVGFACLSLADAELLKL